MIKAQLSTMAAIVNNAADTNPVKALHALLCMEAILLHRREDFTEGERQANLRLCADARASLVVRCVH